MPSSLFGKIKLRLLDRFLSLAEPPNRIDLVCRVSPLAGPVRVGDHATSDLEHSLTLTEPEPLHPAQNRTVSLVDAHSDLAAYQFIVEST